MIKIVIIKDIILLDHVMCFQAVDAKSIRVVITLGRQTSHPAPDRAASRSSILSVAFFGTMMHLRGASLTQRRLFWPGKFLFSSEALNFRAPLS